MKKTNDTHEVYSIKDGAGALTELDFSCAQETLIGGWIASGVLYELEVLHLIRNILEQQRLNKSILIDVGANIGFFPLHASFFCKKNNINLDCYAHEPLPSLYNKALELQQANNINYNLSPLAISEERGSAKFYVSARSDASNSLNANFRKAKEVIEVEVSTLDYLYYNIIKEGNYSEKILLIDVETFEPQVLRGAQRILADFRPLLICEVLYNPTTENQLTPIINEFNYVPFCFDGEHWRLEKTLKGDPTNTHRDFFFVPAERITIPPFIYSAKI